jgi:hypothetical protein
MSRHLISLALPFARSCQVSFRELLVTTEALGERHASPEGRKDGCMVLNGGRSAELPVYGQIVHCRTCGRRLLVERVLIGVNHTVETVVTCWDCLDKAAQEQARQRYQLHGHAEDALRPTD